MVEEAISRIEKLNPQLNAVIYKMYDPAQRTAGAELPEGPFKGVPFLMKELLGPTNNPWDLSRTPSGSSGGSAAAVARGCCPWPTPAMVVVQFECQPPAAVYSVSSQPGVVTR